MSLQAVMGGAFYVNSPNLIEDIGIVEKDWEETHGDETWNYIERKYQQTAMNCFVAAGFYVITLVFSSVTCYLNSKEVV